MADILNLHKASEESFLNETLESMILALMILSWSIFAIYACSIIAVLVKIKKDMFLTFAACISVYFMLFLFLGVLDTFYYVLYKRDDRQ